MKEWTKNFRKVVPYVPGEQPKEKDVIKLNTNENPYDPSPKVMERLNNIDDLRLYPDPAASALVQAVAENFNLDKEQVFVGVGSDDVLAMAFMTFFNSERPIFFPDITYSFYDVWADLFHIPYSKKSLEDTFSIRKEDYYAANGGVIFPNPNAPTGKAVDLSFIEDVLLHNQDVVVIIDEAYVDFGASSAVSLLDKYENLLVVQTCSKSRSLAGMRIGYAIGNRELIAALNDVKYSFNSYTMNQPAIALGVEAMKDRAYFEETTAKIKYTREWFSKEMRELGFIFQESSANFIFAMHPNHRAKDIFEAAKEKKIYVRYFDKPRIDNYLRISIGTDTQMTRLIDFLKEYLA